MLEGQEYTCHVKLYKPNIFYAILVVSVYIEKNNRSTDEAEDGIHPPCFTVSVNVSYYKDVAFHFSFADEIIVKPLTKRL